MRRRLPGQQRVVGEEGSGVVRAAGSRKGVIKDRGWGPGSLVTSLPLRPSRVSLVMLLMGKFVQLFTSLSPVLELDFVLILQ